MYSYLYISWLVYFVTGLNQVLQQPLTAELAKKMAEILKESAYSYSPKTFPIGDIQWLHGYNVALFWRPITFTWTYLTLKMDENWHFLNNLPPLLVHVVIEWPLVIYMTNTNVCYINFFQGKENGFWPVLRAICCC